MRSTTSSRGRRGLPRGPHGLTPSEVSRSQRERLLAAITDAVAERGYPATPVAEVIGRAGVSRKTFYVHFKDRRDCLMAAYEVAADNTLAHVRAVADQARGEHTLQEIVIALCEVAAERPAAFTLQVIDIAAAGQAALLAREQRIQAIGALLRRELEPSASAPRGLVMRLIASGLLGVIEQRAREGKLDGSVEPARELTRWLRSYHPAPSTLLGNNGGIAVSAAEAPLHTTLGGRAPGTLALTSTRVAEAARGVSPSFTAHSQRERILDAVANICAGKGYVSLTVDEVAAVAGVSLNTFYDHFADKEDAFLVAHELGHVRGMAILEQTLAKAPSWDVAIRAAVSALLGFFLSEPAYVRMAAVEAPIASPQTAERSRQHIASYAQLLLDGAPRARKPPPIAQEAIGAALHAAMLAFAVHGVIREPAKAQDYASYLVLAPFLGPSNALLAG